MDAFLDFACDLNVGIADEYVHLRTDTELRQVYAGFDGCGYARDQLTSVVSFPIVEIYRVRVNFWSDAMTESMDKISAVTVFRDRIACDAVDLPTLRRFAVPMPISQGIGTPNHGPDERNRRL